METLDNQMRDLSFEEIKDKCKSRTKVNIYGGLAFIVFTLVLIVGSVIYQKGIQYMLHTQVVASIFLLIIVCVAVWLVLGNYRFLKKMGSLDTPEKLLYGYEKKVRNNRLLYFVSIVALVCNLFDDLIFNSLDDTTSLVMIVPVLIALIAFIAIYWYRGLKDETFKFPGRDVEIIKRLQELSVKE